MIGGSVRGVERSLAPIGDAAGDHDADQWVAHEPPPEPQAKSRPAKRRRHLGLVMFRLLKRIWIPLVVLVVLGAGGLVVSRLHGVFGSEKHASYADTRVEPKPFNPKHVKYEIFGPPDTVAQISYFDGNGDPQNIKGVLLPWSFEFAITPSTAAASVVAQGDRDSISCRISVDGVVKVEKTSNEVSAFITCPLKADE